MNEKLVLIGAGSAMFTRGLIADALHAGWDGEIALCDVDPDALAVAEGLARKMVAARAADVALRASTDRTDLLRGATAVVCTIGVGGRRAWERDVFVPRRHGVYQPVGDTAMPGGISRALRMIPAMVAVAEDVMELAPGALFFNYGNPMSAVCRGVRKATGAPVVGLCHGVHHVAGRLAADLGAPLADFRYTAAGLNHLTWFTEVRVRGVDAMPRLRELARAKIEADENPFCWELFETFGAFPAPGDRHVTEFFPHLFPNGAYRARTLGVDAFSFERTIEGGDAAYAKMRADAESAEPLRDDYFDRSGGEHEQVLEIIAAIRRDEQAVFSANMPNRGQVPNLPGDAIVESPCVATSAGLRPLQLDALPAGVAATLAGRMQCIETTVEAALEGSREKFVQALLLDGSVGSLEVARALADDLLAAQADHLPQFERASSPARSQGVP